MPTALSDTDVCNLALDLLRHKERVSTLTGTLSEVEALAARWYHVCRRSILRNFPFNFARTRASIPRNSTDPAFGYADAYDLPSDYLNLVFVGDNYDADYERDYHVENGQLLIDNSGATSINICYIYDATVVSLFDALFLDLLVAELAVRFSNSLTGINKSMKELIAWKDKLEVRARSKNGQENPPRVRYRSPLIGARRGASRSTTTDGEHLFT